MVPLQDGIPYTKWMNMRNKIIIEGDRLNCDKPNMCSDQESVLFRFIRSLKNKPNQIEIVNRTINKKILYTTDLHQYGIDDVWSSPLETYRSGRGDCEDYVFLKYLILHKLGVSLDRMKILLLWDTKQLIGHAVLLISEKDNVLVLDNRTDIIMNLTDLRYMIPLMILTDTESFSVVSF